MPVDDLSKARVFFDRARKVAETSNFDYAIDMYLEGLGCAPGALHEGHIKLRELALLRQSMGGKKPSVMEKVRRMRGKDPLEKMLNAEYMFAKDPEHLPYAEAMLIAAKDGGYNKTAKWIADLVFQANNAAKKPSLHTYILLKDCYSAIGEFERAIIALQRAAQLKPNDAQLADEYKNLSAELTVSRGKYDQDGDFRKAIKNRQAQEKLQSQQGIVKSDNYRLSAINDAREEFKQQPGLTRNIFNLAEALADLETDEAENEAIELLEKTYDDKKDFSFRQQAGLVKIKQIRRKTREAKTALENSADDTGADSRLKELSEELARTELEHYQLCVENYPTDLAFKYEYAVRLMRDKQYDEAIPLFQEAQNAPGRKITAMDKIGYCFFMKGWFTDAIDVFRQAINSYQIKDDGIAKELRYNLARCCEKNGDEAEALEIYRKIAQLDFGFKDVRKRVDKLRNKNG